MKRLEVTPLPATRPARPFHPTPPQVGPTDLGPPRPLSDHLDRFRAERPAPVEVRPGCRIADDRDLTGLWSFLTGEVVPDSRTLWLAMIDEDGRAAPTVFPIADCPAEPGRDSLENLAGLVAHLIEDGVAATVPALLARPGPGVMTDQDRRWARTLRSVLGPSVSCWSTFLLTVGGLRPFAPDDLISAAARPTPAARPRRERPRER